MLAVLLIAETCEYVPLVLIEAYIFPILKPAALFDASLPEQLRGVTYFGDPGLTGGTVAIVGQNYVKLCT
jgi:hypothetical protein